MANSERVIIKSSMEPLLERVALAVVAIEEAVDE